MDSTRYRLRCRSSIAWLAPLAVLGLAGGWLALSTRANHELRADLTSIHTDMDLDGLNTIQERVLGTHANNADSDGDGFSDLEELARQSSPLSARSVPRENQRLSVGMTAHMREGKIHLMLAMYTTDGNLRNKNLNVGYMAGLALTWLDNTSIAQDATIRVLRAAHRYGRIVLIDKEYDPQAVLWGQGATWCATASIVGSGHVTTAAVCELREIENEICLVVRLNPLELLPMPESAGGQTSIYVPISLIGDEGEIPDTWTLGHVCFQRSSSVGGGGPNPACVIQEVTSSECAPNWDGLCPMSCPSNVGNQFATIDPALLLGN
jgi:hypothetical protein